MPAPLKYNAARFAVFGDIYREELARAVAARPDDYGFRPENTGTVASRMLHAVQHGTFNHDGHAFKATCKRLGIRYTRKAIIAYLESADAPAAPLPGAPAAPDNVPEADRRFVIVTCGATVERNERGELNTDGVIGVVTSGNAYLTAYPAIAEGEPAPSVLGIGQRSRSAKYSLSGTVGHYDIVRVA